MPKISDAKLGDEVVLRGKVTKIGGTLVFLNLGAGDCAFGISPSRPCSEIISPPWIPKIGDRIRWRGIGIIYMIEHILNDKAWLSWVSNSDNKLRDVVVSFDKADYTLCVD
jgi:hypothetical protein